MIALVDRILGGVDAAVDAIATGAPALLIAVTMLLGLGWLGGRLAREYVDRQRWAELAVLASLVAIPLVLCPMDRFLIRSVTVTGERSVAEAPGAAPRGRVTSSTIGPTTIGPTTRTPAKTEPAKTEPAKTEPAKTEPAKTEPAKTEPDKTEPDKTVSHKMQSNRMPPESGGAIGASNAAAVPATAGFADTGRQVGRVLAIVYLLLCAAFTLRLVAGLARLWWLIRRAEPVPLDQLPVELPRGVSVRRGPRGMRPFCTGWFRSVILIPAELIGDETLATVLRHEVAHAKRRDTWSQLLFAVSTPVLFAHPLFWVLRSRARLCAEIVTDADAASASSTQSRNDYARRLLDLAERDTARHRAPVGAVPVFRRRCELSRRIEMLVDPNHRPARRSTRRSRWARLVGVCAMLVGVVGSFGAATLSAQDPERAWTVEERRKVLEKNKELERQLKQLRARIGDPAKPSQEDLLLAKKIRATRIGPTSFTKENGAFMEAFKWVRKITDVPLFVSPEGEAVISDENLVLRMNIVKAVTLENFLDEMTRRSKNLGWTIRHGVVLITGKSRAGSALAGDPSVTNATRPGGKRPRPGQPPTGKGAVAASHAQTILTLIDRLVDARADYETAESGVADLLRARKAGDVDHGDITRAEIRLRAAKRRFKLVRQFAEFELQDAEEVLSALQQDLKQSEQLFKNGFVPASDLRNAQVQLQRARFRVKMIRDTLK